MTGVLRGSAFVAWHADLGSLVLRSAEGGLLLYDTATRRPLAAASRAEVVALAAVHGYGVVS